MNSYKTLCGTVYKPNGVNTWPVGGFILDSELLACRVRFMTLGLDNEWNHELGCMSINELEFWNDFGMNWNWYILWNYDLGHSQ